MIQDFLFQELVNVIERLDECGTHKWIDHSEYRRLDHQEVSRCRRPPTDERRRCTSRCGTKPNVQLPRGTKLAPFPIGSQVPAKPPCHPAPENSKVEQNNGQTQTPQPPTHLFQKPQSRGTPNHQNLSSNRNHKIPAQAKTKTTHSSHPRSPHPPIHPQRPHSPNRRRGSLVRVLARRAPPLRQRDGDGV